MAPKQVCVTSRLRESVSDHASLPASAVHGRPPAWHREDGYTGLLLHSERGNHPTVKTSEPHTKGQWQQAVCVEGVSEGGDWLRNPPRLRFPIQFLSDLKKVNQTANQQIIKNNFYDRWLYIFKELRENMSRIMFSNPKYPWIQQTTGSTTRSNQTQ